MLLGYVIRKLNDIQDFFDFHVAWILGVRLRPSVGLGCERSAA